MHDTYTELYEKLSRLQWLLQRSHFQNHAQRGPAADPTRGQGRVLAMLKMQPDISTKDLSYLLGIRQQSLNELLNKLEKAEYVVRTPSAEDRRVMLVKLTEKGELAQAEKADYSGIFDCLSAEELTAFSTYLDRIIDALQGQLGLDAEDGERSAWMQDFMHRRGNEKFSQWYETRTRHPQRPPHGGRGSWEGHGPDARHGAPPPHHRGPHHGPEFDGPRGGRWPGEGPCPDGPRYEDYADERPAPEGAPLPPDDAFYGDTF